MKIAKFLLFTIPLIAQDSFVLRNVTIHPVTSADIVGGSIVVANGKIVELGAKVTASKSIKVIDGKGLHVYPGMINCATQMGLSEVTSVRESNDTNEIGEFLPQVRAVVAVNPDSEHIPVTRVNGITSSLVLPASLAETGRGAGTGPQPILRGQSAMIHLDGWNWEDMAISRNAGVLMRFPAIVTRRAAFGEGAIGTPIPYNEAKKTYETELKKVEEFFDSAKHYQAAKMAKAAGFKPNVQLDAMIPVLEGKVPLLIAAQKERTIREAIAFAKKQNVKIILLDVTKPGKAMDLIKQNNIPVVVGKPTSLPEDEDDPYDAAYSLPGQLYKAGIKFAFGTYDNQFARNLPYEAAFAVAYGLPYDEALKALTIGAAEIFGVSNEIGSIEKGKSADFVVTDGDPLEVRTQVKMLFIRGKNVSLETKQTRLYEKYMNRK